MINLDKRLAKFYYDTNNMGGHEYLLTERELKTLIAEVVDYVIGDVPEYESKDVESFIYYKKRIEESRARKEEVLG